jgi:hypothetical protein
MGNKQVNNKINFDDVLYAIKNNYIIINVLDDKTQFCLIKNTISYDKEEEVINNLLKSNNENIKEINIIIYGKNCNDNNIILKYNQLITLGFYNIYLYYGGLFEWLLLQDVYGSEIFQTTSKCDDFLIFKPDKIFINNLQYLT